MSCMIDSSGCWSGMILVLAYAGLIDQSMEEDSQPPLTYESKGAKNLLFFSLKKPLEKLSVSVALGHNCGGSNVLRYPHDKQKIMLPSS